MNKLRLLVIFFLSFGLGLSVSAHKPLVPEGPIQGGNNNQATYRGDCAESTSQIDLNINNVRARLLGGGDMWWDFSDARYIVPNVAPGSGLAEVSSIYAGAIWLGGFELDDLGNPANLKMAAQTYRSSTRNDFWPGPLTETGGTNEDICDRWDKQFEVTGEAILEHINNFQQSDFDCAQVSLAIRGWPAKGNTEFANIYQFELPFQDLAPFFDNDGNGLYDPCEGDFPIIEIIGCEDRAGEVGKVSFADQMIWYVFNDNGGIHTRTTADPIRMEVQTLAFAYKTGDFVNDMTFYRYKLLNKSAVTIDSTFFGQWVDADLGCPTDDFIGCDKDRALMYIYNDGTTDGAGGCGNIATYGNQVPILAVDYFRGPKDENGNELGMSSFIYYVNGGYPGLPDTGDPTTGPQFYNYLSGTWRDGSPYYATGNAYNQTGPTTNFVFTGDPDAANDWSMCTENIVGADMRTVQASGPFQLRPGAINELIMGVVWTPNEATYPCPALNTIRASDDLAQALYDNCFKITDGPDAPSIDMIELDKKLVLLLTNDTATSNNKFLSYNEKDLQAPPGEEDSMYVFEGYKVYQIAEPNFNDLNDPDQARLIFQSDLNNGVTEIYNWEQFPGDLGPTPVYIPTLKVDGADKGLSSSLVITEDQFAEGDRNLVNHKTYYFVAIAYAYNNYQDFNAQDGTGQKSAYLEGRRNVIISTGIPRIPTPEFGGITLNSDYGDGAVITRFDGEGTGLNFLDLNDETVAAILARNIGDDPLPSITYKQGQGPITVKVIDPLRVQPGDYSLKIFDNNLADASLDDDARWELETPSGEKWFSEMPLSVLNEQLLVGKNSNGESVTLGISVTIGQVDEPGTGPLLAVGENNGFIGATLTYTDPNAIDWILPVSPNPNAGFLNYVPTGDAEVYQDRDPQQVYKSVLDGAFVPYTLTLCQDATAPALLSPGWETPTFCNIIHNNNPLSNLRNVDIVMTSNKALWSRCAVVETARRQLTTNGFTSEGGKNNMDLRAGQSIGKDGQPDGTGTGMSWFPGYAIDMETGQRLNIFFGENSVYRPDEPTLSALGSQLQLTGGDMIFNPTDEQFVDLDASGTFTGAFELIYGNQHYIYVSSTEYDECADIATKLDGTSAGFKVQVFSKVPWTAFPVLPFGGRMLSMEDGLVPADLTVKLRVQNSYSVSEDRSGPSDGYPQYQFTLDGNNPDANNSETAKSALDLVNIVPNPYYAYSAYELQNTANTVKITNLPPLCTVSIYSLDGKFIRKYDRAENTNRTIPQQGAVTEQINASIDWDMKNARGIPISSGIYLIHVDAPGIGERTLKWFGVQRTFDTYRN